ncbi:MAG TPA: hypothetical protein VLR47_01570 [Rhodospirillales bacterium]|nr:hypothetical protein [Rhodospirillales bacterium]
MSRSRPLVHVLILNYRPGMNAERDDLSGLIVELITEALLANPRFRRGGRDWARWQEDDRRLARLCAMAIADHLHRCGIEWVRKPPLSPHRAGE